MRYCITGIFGDNLKYIGDKANQGEGQMNLIRDHNAMQNDRQIALFAKYTRYTIIPFSGVGSGVAPGAGAPPCWRALFSFSLNC